MAFKINILFPQTKVSKYQRKVGMRWVSDERLPTPEEGLWLFGDSSVITFGDNSNVKLQEN